MSEFPWPHPSHAEDQPYAKTLLYVHVFHRGFEAGGVIGLFYANYKLYKHRQQLKLTPPQQAALGGVGKNAGIRNIFYPTMARASLIGAGASMVLLTARMWGAEEVEWQDRSWRLLENEGQVMHDLYADVGAGIAASTIFVAGGSRPPLSLMVREMVGRAGLGAVVGFVGCEVVRKYKLYASKD
ncbi:hypothetical protein TMatcc_010727 [Talaromyces marneffei ATCC 18224]|uniref:Uncharacterized protein n=1 Tax=Talaromyces marneffei (strain ATCC 18224 / CBS 334.59 / QM 7333) TaxID=441960 RepID=B6QUT0_TALMQ|nr:conserved hypothetical protein [Talaromyces marneffei ATCC 18224]KAE8548456.1 hypothetical protein EYB25_008834 [Talaromyces marneffei]